MTTSPDTPGGTAATGGMTVRVTNPGEPGGGPDFLCDAAPEVFAVFAFAVLALHQPRSCPGVPDPVCSCGTPAPYCPVRSLADGLLFAADPARPE